MVIGCARLTVHIPASRSLKDKRSVTKSILAQVQREYRVSAAEVGHLDERQLAVLGLCYVTNDAAHADEVIAKSVRFVEAHLRDGVLLDFETEVMHAF